MILQYIKNPIDLLRDGIQDICEAIVLKDYKEKNLVKRGSKIKDFVVLDSLINGITR